MGLFTGKTVIVTGGGKATLKDGSAGSIGYGHRYRICQGGREPRHHRPQRRQARGRQGVSRGRVRCQGSACSADVSAGQDNEAVVQNVIDKAIEEFGRIDAVVNNAQPAPRV